jgi:CubicO group peptidase (beta-lactamase class C family)
MTAVDGMCEPRFAEVRSAFAAGHDEGAARGAALAVQLSGEPVVDLWCGQMRDGTRWRRDTLCCAFSVAKAVTATALAILVDRRELDLDAPVATWWPEFGQAGKGAITLRTVLTHRAATNWFPGYESVVSCDDPGGFADLPAIWDAIAAAPPLWKPGTRVAYTSMTLGWIASAIVQRVTAKSLAAFVADEICKPLDLTRLHLGVPAEQLADTVDLAPEDAWEAEQLLANINPQQPGGKNLFLRERTLGNAMLTLWNDDRYRCVEQGAINLISTARDLAALFAVWAGRGSNGQVRLFSEPTADAFIAENASTLEDAVIHSPLRLGLVFWRPIGDFRFGPHDEAVAHIGLGGAMGIADPVSNVSIAYLPGVLRVQSILGTDLRMAAVIDAIFAALG